jgi:hypothetical protein
VRNKKGKKGERRGHRRGEDFGEAVLLVNGGISPVVDNDKGVADEKRKRTANL